jgi:hypothetical protein
MRTDTLIELNTRTLEMICEYIAAHGPERVLTNAEGSAVPLRQALENNIKPDVILVRNDGWSIGAKAELERPATNLYLDDWIAVMRRGLKNKWEIERYDITRVAVKKLEKEEA